MTIELPEQQTIEEVKKDLENRRSRLRITTEKHLPPEIFFGIVIGLLLYSWILIVTHGWASFGVYPFLSLITGGIGGILWFVRKKISGKQMVSSKRYSKYLTVKIFVIVCFLCIFLPYLTVKGYYLIRVANIPIPSGLTRTQTKTLVFGYDDGAGYFIEMEGNVATPKVFQFYRQYLEQQNWQEKVKGHESLFSRKNEMTFYKKGGHRMIRVGRRDYLSEKTKTKKFYFAYSSY
ncbi:MAG: hypothetical protein LBQ54_06455 [Planctomycetaceae bacterium]|nr:hypothetical protein [Planctomycetaceae bacterium]